MLKFTCIVIVKEETEKIAVTEGWELKWKSTFVIPSGIKRHCWTRTWTNLQAKESSGSSRNDRTEMKAIPFCLLAYCIYMVDSKAVMMRIPDAISTDYPQATNDDGFLLRSEYGAEENSEQEKIDRRRTQYYGKIFEDFDWNFDMKLSLQEVKEILAHRFALKPRPNFQSIFKSFDKNHDAGLDLSEYTKFDQNVPFEEMDPLDDAASSEKSIKEKLPLQKKSKQIKLP